MAPLAVFRRICDHGVSPCPCVRVAHRHSSDLVECAVSVLDRTWDLLRCCYIAIRDRLSVPPQAMPNLHGLVFGIADGKLPEFWIQIVSLALSLCVFVWTAIRGRRIHSASGLILLA